MSANKINWARVVDGLERDGNRMIVRPYGWPAIIDPERSAFVDMPIQAPWKIPDKMIVSVAITGAFFTREANSAQPITVQHIYEEARACAESASTVHLHVRDDRGYNTLSLDRFSKVVEPLRQQFPHLALDGCLVATVEGEWEVMKQILDAKLFDAVPINTTAVYTGDTLCAKPVPVMLEKARLVQESGAKPLIAVYTDGDVNNADRYLIKSGLVGTPSYWCVLPALPGCSPMENPRQMFDGLLRIASIIYDIDSEATILVCAAGRATIYLATAAALLGLHIRVGMEDTVWLWPHRNEKAQSNMQFLEMAKSLATVLGRDIANHEEYRQIVGLPARTPLTSH